METSTAEDPHPDVTVAVCTWNRAALLRRTLASFAALKIPPGVRWEVLVVENNCTDGTAGVLGEFAATLPLRAVREVLQGTSHARNRVAQEARGEYVLCTDDDVEVDAGWLAAHWAAFRAHPHADVFGGVIRPRFEGTPPRWLGATWQMIAGVYAGRDLGPQGFDLEPIWAHLPYGPNFAVRGATLRRHRCNPSLGPNGPQRGIGDETTLLIEILRAGARGRWVPDAVVHHWVPRQRQRLAFVREHHELVGRLTVPPAGSTSRSLDKRRRTALRKRRKSLRAYWWARLSQPAPVWMEHFVRAARLRGELAVLAERGLTPVAPPDADVGAA